MKKIVSEGLAVSAAMGALIFGALASSATPAVYEKRVINYQPVDLLPLFVWWEKPHGLRPLTSWKHVLGSLERESVYGWLVRGTVEGQAGMQYFLLKSPPRKELARYRELESALPKLEQDRASALAIAKLPAYKGFDWDIYGDRSRIPTEDFDRIEKAKADLQDIDSRIDAARREIARMLDARGYFKVDAFALQLNQVYEGNPVFDFGFPPF